MGSEGIWHIEIEKSVLTEFAAMWSNQGINKQTPPFSLLDNLTKLMLYHISLSKMSHKSSKGVALKNTVANPQISCQRKGLEVYSDTA